MVTKKPKGLGLGLEALLGPKVSDTPAPERDGTPSTLKLEALQAGKFCRTEATLAGDDLVGHAADGRDGPHQDGLHDPLRLDPLGQLVERALVHARARLLVPGQQGFQLQRGGRAVALGRGRVADLGAE